MKSTNTFGMHFVARPKKTDPDELLIYVRITVSKKIAEISLKRTIDTKFWDQSAECIKGNKKLSAEFNPYLDNVRYKLMESFRKLHEEKKSITAQALKDSFLGKEQSNSTLCDLIKYHNENMVTVLAPGTLKNYFTTERYVKLFLEKKHRVKDIPLSELNFQFINEFEFFLRRTEPLDQKNPLGNNGIMKHMERLRKMVTLAAKMEWIAKDPFQQYSLRFLKVDKEFLTCEELATVEEKKFKIQKLNLARDLFVFSCYTGLAYMDLMKLNLSEIDAGIDGKLWIKTNRGKTKTPVIVPLLPNANDLFEKYRNDPRAINRGKVFPKLSNQKMNKYLKEIGKECDIVKDFTFHTARHTFGTTTTLSNGVPIESVSKMLGHTKLSTTQGYARVLERKISEDMAALHTKFSNVRQLNLKAI